MSKNELEIRCEQCRENGTMPFEIGEIFELDGKRVKFIGKNGDKFRFEIVMTWKATRIEKYNVVSSYGIMNAI